MQTYLPVTSNGEHCWDVLALLKRTSPAGCVLSAIGMFLLERDALPGALQAIVDNRSNYGTLLIVNGAAVVTTNISVFQEPEFYI